MTRATTCVGVRQRRRARNATRPKHSELPAHLRTTAVPVTDKTALAPISVVVRPVLPDQSNDHRHDRAVGVARRDVRKKLRLIRNHLDRGDNSKAYSAQHKLLASHSLKVVGAARARARLAWLARANAKALGRFVAGRPYGPTREQARQVAEAIRLPNTTRERVGVKALRKSKGGYRKVHMFELEYRARHEMLRLVLVNRAPTDPRQYARMGLRAAQRDIMAALDTGRYDFVVAADISDFFASIDVTALPAMLGLSTGVVDSNVRVENFNLDHRQMAAAAKEIANYETMNPRSHHTRDYSRYDGGVRTDVIDHRHRFAGQRPPGSYDGCLLLTCYRRIRRRRLNQPHDGHPVHDHVDRRLRNSGRNTGAG